MLICIFSIISGGLDRFQVVSPVDPFAGCCSADTFFLISCSQRAGVHISDSADQVKGKAKTSWKVSQRDGKRRRADAGRRAIVGACSSAGPNRESKQTRQTNIVGGEGQKKKVEGEPGGVKGLAAVCWFNINPRPPGRTKCEGF